MVKIRILITKVGGEQGQHHQNQPHNQGFHNGSTSGWGNKHYTGNVWGSSNPYNWHNPFGLNIPQISFVTGCRKCNGSGVINRKGKQIPCRKCYRTQGHCVKCYGTGVNFMRNKPC